MIFAQSNNRFNYFWKSFVISKHMGVFTKYLIIIVRYIISKMRKIFVKNNKVFIRMLLQKWFHPIAQINAKTRVIKLWKVSVGFCRNAMESLSPFFSFLNGRILIDSVQWANYITHSAEFLKWPQGCKKPRLIHHFMNAKINYPLLITVEKVALRFYVQSKVDNKCSVM